MNIPYSFDAFKNIIAALLLLRLVVHRCQGVKLISLMPAKQEYLQKSLIVLVLCSIACNNMSTSRTSKAMNNMCVNNAVSTACTYNISTTII